MQEKINKMHGLTHHRLYGTWKAIIARCYNKKHIAYKNYGGRGIKVCDRWLDTSSFIKDMHPSYQEGLSIDRIDVNGNYEIGNVRWSTNTTQQRNTRLLYVHNTSGYMGVSFNKKNRKWVATISVNNNRKYLGYFETSLDAAKAYDKYVIDNNLEHTINGVHNV